MRIRWFNSFKLRLFLALFFVFIFPALFITALYYERSIDTIYRSSEAFMGDILEQSVYQFDQRFQYWNEIAASISESAEIAYFFNAYTTKYKQDLELIRYVIPYLDQFTQSPDIDTIRIYPIEPAQYSIPIYQISYIEERLQDQFIMDRVVEMDGKPLWIGNTSIHGRNETWVRYSLLREAGTFKPKAVLAISISEKAIRNLVQFPTRWVNKRTLIVDENGIIISDSLGRRLLGQALAPTLADVIQHEQTGSIIHSFSEITSQITYMPIPIKGWFILNSIPLDDLMLINNKIKFFTISLFLVSLLFIFILSLYLGRYLSMPIQQLVLQMKKIRNGDFRLTTRKKRGDEFEYLLNGFELMVRHITELLDNIRASEKKKQELQFQIHANQINPHLVYNTLDTIKWKVLKLHHSDSEEILKLISLLAQFMRLSLNKGNDITTIAHELDHIKTYLTLEQHRNPHSFRVIYDVPDRLLRYATIKLILHPIVENVLLHGKTIGHRTKIIISCELEKETLVFRIIDNGPGLPKYFLEHSVDKLYQEGRLGIGIYNVHERLRLMYGDIYGVTLKSGEEWGTIVEIRFPA